MHLLLAVWDRRLGLGEDLGQKIGKELAGWKIRSLSQTGPERPPPILKLPWYPQAQFCAWTIAGAQYWFLGQTMNERMNE